jgi:hypothetical protein
MRKHLALFTLLAACNGTTGSALVRFTGTAQAPEGIAADQPYQTGSGYSLVLHEARMHLGAVYLNQDNPLSGRGEVRCVLPGTYVGQIFGPLDLDLLSSAKIAFPNAGEGTQTRALTAEVWLLEGDIDAPDSQTPVLEVSGTASRGAEEWRFSATVTIGQNRMRAPPSAAMPGANPICQQRIVTPIVPVDGEITPTDGGQLSLVVDPRAMFEGVSFELLGPSGAEYTIPDELGGVSDQLFGGLRANAGVYAIGYR